MHDFPVEIWLKIINDIGKQHPSAYRLGPGGPNVLARLCRLNSTFRLLSEPILYSAVYITPENLEAFTRMVLGQGKSAPLEFVPSVKGHLVKRLAIAEFEKRLKDEEIECIGTILYALRSVITHLLFDVNLPYIDWVQPICSNNHAAICYAMRELSSLEEFCTFDGFRLWHKLQRNSPWPRLRRLAFTKAENRSSIKEKIQWTCTLETCVMFADFQGPLVVTTDPADHSLASETLKRMVIVCPKNRAKDYISDVDLWFARSRRPDRDPTINQCLKVVELPDTPDVLRETTMHFRSAVIDGKIWDM
ncbi:hypothetical protein FRB93_005877 [Tulasnella sp. JGI-2019a]|nr:hypothetical protein FRB93_005877 [Tulasnella sp. JGI-2019a]